jgi:uncharacterized membrane protein YccC
VFVDPHRVNLRKAARATLVVTVLFAALVALGDDSVALYAAFGSFAALVFADFGGPAAGRIRAYAVLLVGGGALVALGDLCADTTVLAVVAMLVVGFAVTLSGALGGYYAAGGVALILAFVLSVMSPGAETGLLAREVGWCLGVGVAGLSAVTLWPVHQRHRVRTAAADVLDAAAGALAQPPDERDLAPVHDAARALRARTGMLYRPAGSTARDHALVALVVALRRLPQLLEALEAADASPAADPLPEYAGLTARTAATLAAAARLFTVAAAIDLDPLHAARRDHTAALERWAATELATVGAGDVLARFDAAFPLRRLSLLAAELAVQAARATGSDAHASDPVALPEATRPDRRASVVLRAHLNPRSVRFRNATRTAVGLALAVLIARGTSVDHAFWVVLGTLSVLRSNALGTGATALQALLGALVGFGVASAVMLTIGSDQPVLWVLLPLVIFSSAYTPGAVNFVVGQASFTVFVVTLFNLLQPEGWRTGLVRVQDVAIGAGISVVVGALLWPRGARGVAREAFAEVLAAARHFFDVAVSGALAGHPRADAEAARDAVSRARGRAVAALEDLAVEHGGGAIDRSAWTTRLAGVTVLRIAADGVLRAHPDPGDRAAGCVATRAALAADAGDVLAALVDAARTGDLDTAPVAAARSALASCLGAHVHEGLDAALGLVWIYEWIAMVRLTVAALATPGVRAGHSP